MIRIKCMCSIISKLNNVCCFVDVSKCELKFVCKTYDLYTNPSIIVIY